MDSRSLRLAGILILAAGAVTVRAGGHKMTATSYQWKVLWQGHGPAGSPTGAPPGLTVVHSKAAWTRFITSYGPPYDAQTHLPVNWEKDVLLSVQTDEDNLGTEVLLKSVSRTGNVLAIAAVRRVGAEGPSTLGVEARPWILASVPAAALTGNPQIRFTLDDREAPVAHER